MVSLTELGMCTPFKIDSGYIHTHGNGGLGAMGGSTNSNLRVGRFLPLAHPPPLYSWTWGIKGAMRGLKLTFTTPPPLYSQQWGESSLRAVGGTLPLPSKPHPPLMLISIMEKNKYSY